MELSTVDRQRILRARVKTATPAQLHYLELDTRRRLESGFMTQGTHDFIIDEITIKNGGVRSK